MNTSRPSAVTLTPAIRAEAAAWVAKIHSSGRTSAMEAALKAWLATDATHARAFEIATTAWEAVGAIPSTAVPRIDPSLRRARRRVRWRPALAAAALACVGIAVAIHFRDPMFATGTGEQRSVTLADGSHLTLNTDSRVRVQFTDAQRRVELEAGEAFFEVAKNPQRPFIVTAGSESVVAVGTAFMVQRSITGGEIAITLVEGKVRVAPVEQSGNVVSASAVQVLTPGQRLRVKGSTPSLDQPNIEAVTAWRRGEVVLDHTRLSDAVTEMNRYSQVKLVVSSSDSVGIEVSGIFRAGDSARFARAIADTYQLDVIEEPERILIAGSPRPAVP
jgi:transmembrane sensor